MIHCVRIRLISMSRQQEHTIACPYCGEHLAILVDPSVEAQDYIEDCQVCCRPIELAVRCPDGQTATVEARHEDEV